MEPDSQVVCRSAPADAENLGLTGEDGLIDDSFAGDSFENAIEEFFDDLNSDSGADETAGAENSSSDDDSVRQEDFDDSRMDGTPEDEEDEAPEGPEEWEDVHDSVCGECEFGGELLCCDTCTRSYHLECIGLKEIPEAFWQCHLCMQDTPLPASAFLRKKEGEAAADEASEGEVKADGGKNAEEDGNEPVAKDREDDVSAARFDSREVTCHTDVLRRFLRGPPRMYHIQGRGEMPCFVKLQCRLDNRSLSRVNRNFTCGPAPGNHARARKRAQEFVDSPEFSLWLEEKTHLENRATSGRAPLTSLSEYDDPPTFSRTPASAKFKVGWKVEAVNRRVPEDIAVATIVQVDPSRLLLDFDGHPKEHRYWVSVKGMDFAPAGTCRSMGKVLKKPPGHHGQFIWKHYLRLCRAEAAPRTVFASGVHFPSHRPIEPLPSTLPSAPGGSPATPSSAHAPTNLTPTSSVLPPGPPNVGRRRSAWSPEASYASEDPALWGGR
eukprot:Rmarinus@m.5516